MSADGKFQVRNTKSARLTAEQVQYIRSAYATGRVTQGALAKEYGVSVIQVGRIVRGEVWQHLPPPAVGQDQHFALQQRLLAEQAAVTGLEKLQSVAKQELRGKALLDELDQATGGKHDAGYE